MERIDITKVDEKWLKLLLRLQNSTAPVFQLTFRDAEAAKAARKRFYNVMDRNPSWFRLMLILRDCNIYVIKTDRIHKAVIDDAGMS